MAKRWTEREINYLESKYLNQAVSITAKRLNRTEYAVVKKALEPAWVRCEKFSYDRPNKGKYWTDMEINYAKSMLRRGMSYREVAKELGRTQSGVAHKCAYIYNG